MKKFLYRGCIFLIILLGFFVLNFLVNFFIFENEEVNIDGKILIAGDSHSKRAINPEILGNAVNISQQGEPYYITFWKLKKIFNENSIDTLILSFAPHNIAAFNDLKLSNDRWSGEMFKRIYPIQEFSSMSGIEIDYLKFYKILWKQTSFYPKLSHINYKGSYVNSKNSNLSDAKESIKRQYFLQGKQLGVSKVSISYLDSILNLCASYKIEPILVSSPVHPSYFTLVPKDIIERYSGLNDSFRRRGIKVMDRTNIIYPDSLYFDVHHLNEMGADRFSKELKKTVINNNYIDQ